MYGEVFAAWVDAAVFYLKRDGRVSVDQILKRSKSAKLHASLDLDKLRRALEEDRGFGSLIPMTAESWEPQIDSDGKPLWDADRHPEKFIAGLAGSAPTAGWCTLDSPLGMQTGPTWQRFLQQSTGGLVEKCNEVRKLAHQPTLRIFENGNSTPLLPFTKAS